MENCTVKILPISLFVLMRYSKIVPQMGEGGVGGVPGVPLLSLCPPLLCSEPRLAANGSSFVAYRAGL